MFVLVFCLLKVTGEVYTVPESNESFDWSAIIIFVAKMNFFPMTFLLWLIHLKNLLVGKHGLLYGIDIVPYSITRH
jgi:hypothetical protein